MKLKFILITTTICFGQVKSTYNIDFTDPKSVLNTIFYAAQTKDFSILQMLCDPYGKGDKDTGQLCSLASINEQIEEYGGNEKTRNIISDFVSMFETGRITGQITYETDENGTQYSIIPFWFNHPGGESRSNETMKLVNRHGNWHLYSF